MLSESRNESIIAFLGLGLMTQILINYDPSPCERIVSIKDPNATAPSKRDTQYFEMFANRAIYHDGWIAATTPPAAPWALGTAKLPPINDYKWELYNISEDFSEYNDLAAKNPDKLKEL